MGMSPPISYIGEETDGRDECGVEKVDEDPERREKTIHVQCARQAKVGQRTVGENAPGLLRPSPIIRRCVRRLHQNVSESGLAEELLQAGLDHLPWPMSGALARRAERLARVVVHIVSVARQPSRCEEWERVVCGG